MAIRIVSIDMVAGGHPDFPAVTIRVVFDNNRYQAVTVDPALSPVAVADALDALAQNIRNDPGLFG